MPTSAILSWSLLSTSPDLQENEELLFSLDATLWKNTENSCGEGKLFVTSRRLLWAANTEGFQINFKDIVLHAISRDQSFFPHPCLYCHIAVEGTETETEEIRLVPSDENQLNALFEAFSKAASMNPDQEQEGEGDFFYDADELESERLQRFTTSNGTQFEDAVEENDTTEMDED